MSLPVPVAPPDEYSSKPPGALSKMLFLVVVIFGGSTACVAQSTKTYLLVVPPSATVAGSGCACDGACGQPDGTWLNAVSYATQDDCSTAIPMAALPVTDATGT